MIPVRTTSVTSAVSTEEPGLTTIGEGVGGGGYHYSSNFRTKRKSSVRHAFSFHDVFFFLKNHKILTNRH